MVCLSSLGVDIGPLLAGAGVIGIAVGFGAQTLVRDVISGVFFLAETPSKSANISRSERPAVPWKALRYVPSGCGTTWEQSIPSLLVRSNNSPIAVATGS